MAPELMSNVAERLKQRTLQAISESRAGNPKPLFFLHIPKTAGTSLTYEINESAVRYKNIFVKDYRDGLEAATMLRSALKEIRCDPRHANITAYSSHTTLQGLIDTGWQLEKINLVTMLRNPIQRCISEYLYERSEANPLHVNFINKFPDITDFIDDKRYQNTYWRYLKTSNASSTSEVIENLASNTAFVGNLEMYPLSVYIITALVGKPHFPSRRERATSRKGVDISADVRKRIARANRIDMEIYRTFRSALEDNSEILAARMGIEGLC